MVVNTNDSKWIYGWGFYAIGVRILGEIVKLIIKLMIYTMMSC
jgi:hypothetical protein